MVVSARNLAAMVAEAARIRWGRENALAPFVPQLPAAK
jgi:hypothetical protein